MAAIPGARFRGGTTDLYSADVVTITGAGAPVDGVDGAGVAGPGSLYIRVAGANTNIYINANTKASPTWKLITRAA